MEDFEDDWEKFVTLASKQRIRKLPLDDYVDLEESERDDDDYDDQDDIQDDGKSELACPFCSEDFDVVGLCCHIDDEHSMESKCGICPICVVKVGTSMAAHVITQHESLLKSLCKKKLSQSGSRSLLSVLRKQMQDKHQQSLSKGSSTVVASSSMEPDPLLLSFVCNMPSTDKPKIRQATSPTETSLADKSSDGNVSPSNFPPDGRNIEASLSPDKDKQEKSQRCEFVHGLLFSTIFSDS